MSRLLQHTMLLIVLVLFSFNTPAWANIDVTPEEATDLIDTNPGLIITQSYLQQFHLHLALDLGW